MGKLLLLLLGSAILLVSPSLLSESNINQQIKSMTVGKDYVPGQVIIKRSNKMLSQSATKLSAQIFSSLHVQAIEEYDHIERLKVVKLGENISVKHAIRELSKDPSIEFAEPDYIYYMFDDETKDPEEEAPILEPAPDPEPVVGPDPKFGEEWFLENTGQKIRKTNGTSGVDIKAVEAWNSVTGSKDFAIMIIDTGVDHTHKDLNASMWVNPNEIAGDGIDNDKNGFVDDIHGINAITNKGDPLDDNGHGTHVAGSIGAVGNNAEGVSGVMQSASIIGCKFLSRWGGGSTSNAVKCLDYALGLKKAGVNILATNNSWGGGPFSSALFEATKEQMKAGILFFAAAGNEYSNNDNRETYPASFYLPNVVAVAASDKNDNKPPWSNYGKRTVHIAAPGVDIMSTYKGGAYKFLSGTSMATPVAAGALGLLKTQEPDFDWIALRNTMIAGGTPTEMTATKVISGKRIVLVGEKGEGILTCHEQIVSQRIRPKRSTKSLKVGETLNLAAISINCAKSHGEHVLVAVKDITPPPKPEPKPEPPKKDAGGENEKEEDRPEPPKTEMRIFEAEDEPTTSLVALLDNGKDGDLVENDGYFSGAWSPTKPGIFELTYGNSDVVKVTVKAVKKPEPPKKEKNGEDQ